MANQEKNTNRLKFIAIHLGAKNSNHDEEAAQLARHFCQRVKQDSTISSALEGVVQLVKLMENNPKLNCGFGSSLSLRGQVECDASVMFNKTKYWAGVGALTGCRNPISMAKCMHDSRCDSNPLGLIQPNLLVGSGAQKWMQTHCPQLAIHNSKLISSKALAKYQKLKSRYDDFKRSLKTPITIKESVDKTMIIDEISSGLQTSSNRISSNNDAMEENQLSDAMDTVGAVAIDMDNNFACAISSGGLWLKQSGRLGQASVPGAGCWCDNSSAVVTTGVGEYLTSTLFAKKFHEKLDRLKLVCELGSFYHNKTLECDDSIGSNTTINHITKITHECFHDVSEWAISAGFNNIRPAFGLLAICNLNLTPNIHPSDSERTQNSSEQSGNEDIYLTFGHNTQSLCVGYMSLYDQEAKSIISTLADRSVVTDDDQEQESFNTPPSSQTVVKTVKIT